MPVKIAIAQIQLSEGQRVTLENINWQEFEDILEDLGEHRHSLMAYYKGVLEFRKPSIEQQRAKAVISLKSKDSALRQLYFLFLIFGNVRKS